MVHHPHRQFELFDVAHDPNHDSVALGEVRPLPHGMPRLFGCRSHILSSLHAEPRASYPGGVRPSNSIQTETPMRGSRRLSRFSNRQWWTIPPPCVTLGSYKVYR